MSAATYYLRDHAGALLYVGCSKNPDARVRSHLRKPWGASVASTDVVWHATRAEAAVAEFAAMQTEQPRHNRVMRLDTRTNETWKAARHPRGSARRRLADVLLDETLDEFVAARRAQGRSWRAIARDLWEATNGRVDASDETIRAWFRPTSPAARADEIVSEPPRSQARGTARATSAVGGSSRDAGPGVSRPRPTAPPRTGVSTAPQPSRSSAASSVAAPVSRNEKNAPAAVVSGDDRGGAPKPAA